MTYTNEDITRGTAVINKAKAQLIVDKATVFYAALLLKRPMQITTALPTAAVDALGNIYVNPGFFSKLSVPQAKFALVHELEHIMRLHAPRMGHRDPKRWNHAGDAVINDQLMHDNIGEFIDGCVNMPGSREQLTEAVYDSLPDNPGGKGGDDDGDQSGDQSGGGLGDDLIPGDGTVDPNAPRTPSPSEVAQAEAQVKVDIAEAAQAAKMQGGLSGDMERRVRDILDVHTPWYEILERWMTARANTDYSWQRPNRRFVAGGMYLPSLQSEGALGHVVIGVDTSGSIGQRELDEFAAHVNRILEQTTPSRLTIIYCDSAVAHVDDMEQPELPVTLVAHGGGGTDMTQIFRYVEQMDSEPDCCIVLTDGYTPHITEREPYPVAMLVTTGVDIPDVYDEVIRYTRIS